MSRLLDTYHKATEARDQRLRTRDPSPRPPETPPVARPVSVAHHHDRSVAASNADSISKVGDTPTASTPIDHEGNNPSSSPLGRHAITAGLLLLTVTLATLGSWPYRGYLAQWLSAPSASTQGREEADRSPSPKVATQSGSVEALAILPATGAGRPATMGSGDSRPVPTPGLAHPTRQAMQPPSREGGIAQSDRRATRLPPVGLQAPRGSAPWAGETPSDQGSSRRHVLPPGPAAPGAVAVPRGGSPTAARRAANPIASGQAAMPAGGNGTPSSPDARQPGNRAQALLSPGLAVSNNGGTGGGQSPTAVPGAPSDTGNGHTPTPAQALLAPSPTIPSAADAGTGNSGDSSGPTSAGALIDGSNPLPEGPASTEQDTEHPTGTAGDLLADQGDLLPGASGAGANSEVPAATEGAGGPSAGDLLDPADLSGSDASPAATGGQDSSGTPIPTEVGSPRPSARDLLTDGASPPSSDTPANGTGTDTNAGNYPAIDDPTGSSIAGPASSDPAPPQGPVLPEVPSASDTGFVDGSAPASPTSVTADVPVTPSPQTGNDAFAEQASPEASAAVGTGGVPTDTQTPTPITGNNPAGDPAPAGTDNGPTSDNLLSGTIEAPPDGDPGSPQGWQTNPDSNSSPDNGSQTQDPSGNIAAAPAPNPPGPVSMPSGSEISNSAPAPAPENTGSSGPQSDGASHPQAANDSPGSDTVSATGPSPLTSLFPASIQTPLATTQSDISLAVDIEGALVLPNPYALFTTGADTRTKASAGLTNGSMSGHIADATTSATILPGSIAAQGGTALSAKRIASMDFAGFTRAESLFDQPLGAWAESIGGAGVDSLAVMPLTSDASIDLSWDINRLAVKTSPSNALSVMRHVALVTQTPVSGDPSQAITALLGFSILSQNGHSTVTTYELPGSTAIGDWLATAGDSNAAHHPGPSVAVPLTDQFIDPLTRLPALNVSLNVAQYEYSIEAPAVAVRPVAERAGAVGSGAKARWDATGKRLTFDSIPIEILSSDGQSMMADRFRHDALAGAHIEIDPLLYAGNLNGRDYFLGNEVRLIADDGAILFQGAVPTVVYDDSLYSETGFNLFSPLLSPTWQQGDGSSWLDQFATRMDAEDLFMPELFIGFDLPDSPIGDWLSNDFEVSADAMLSFATSPAFNHSYSDTSETRAETPAGALASLRTDYEPTAPLGESDQIGTSGISLPEYDPWANLHATLAAPSMRAARSLRSDAPRPASHRAPARPNTRASQSPAGPAVRKTPAPQPEAATLASQGDDPTEPGIVEHALIDPMIAELTRQLPSQVLEAGPRITSRKLDPTTQLPKSVRQATTPAVSSASTGLLLTVGMSILVVAGAGRRRVFAGNARKYGRACC